jgi:hypothetical protein
MKAQIMVTSNARKLFRFVSIIVMVALTSVFAHSMAKSYFNSMQCITDMSAVCQSAEPAAENHMVYQGNNAPAGDEWLCSLGETHACASTTNSLEVAALGNK